VSKRERIGVLGGTFDPLHNTHCAVARAALDMHLVDRVLFVVAGRPPHKNEGPYATADERYAMVEAALAEESRMEPCSLEIAREGPSYTRDTLAELHRLNPDADLALIVGFDTLLDIPNWKDPDGVLGQAHLLVVQRPGAAGRVPARLEGAYSVLPFEADSLSSTEVRQRVAAGESVTGLVPTAVRNYIKRHGLYQVSIPVRALPRAAEFIECLVQRLRKSTRRHCLSTADYMYAIAEQVGVDRGRAAMTGLLHDLAKDMTNEEFIQAAEAFGIPVNDVQRQVPVLLHGQVAAEECRHRLGIDDEAVYEAIYWHTTGRPGLGPLGLALYVADFSEPLRTFPEAAVARDVMDSQGFRSALRYVVRQKVDRLLTRKKIVDPISKTFEEWVLRDSG